MNTSDASGNLFFLINSSLCLFVVTLNFLLNSWIIFLICHQRTLRTIANILIANLSIAAVSYSILAFIACFYNLREEWAYEQDGCTLRAFLIVVSLAAVCYSCAVQALSRLFFALYYQHRFLLRWPVHWLMIVSAWIISVLIGLVPLQTKNGLMFERESRVCAVPSRTLSVASFCIVTIYLIPLSVVILVYVLILLHVRRSTRRLHPNVVQRQTIFQAKRELSLIRRLVLQVSSFAAGGLLYLFNMLWQAVTSLPLPRPIFLIALHLITLSLFTSSLVQLGINKHLRDRTRRYFHCLNCR